MKTELEVITMIAKLEKMFIELNTGELSHEGEYEAQEWNERVKVQIETLEWVLENK